MRVPWLLVPLCTVAVVTSAQAPEPTQGASGKPAFEVASVRLNTQRPDSMSFGGPPGRFEARNLSLELLITQAYGVRREQIEGAPDWVASERFDITAKMPDGAPADQRNAMVQSLLEDRFKLVTHRETREGRVYSLLSARESGEPGPRLTPTTDDCARIREERAAATRAAAPAAAGRGNRALIQGGPGQTERIVCSTSVSGRATPGGRFTTTYRMGGVTMATLAGFLEGNVGAPVTDRTGLTGEYDLELEFSREPALATTAPDGGGPALGDVPTIFTAVEEQLGLKLQPERGPVEYLVIDRVERPDPD